MRPRHRSYRNKFIDFINLFLSQHMHRMETSLRPLSLLELLELLFRFTFMMVSSCVCASSSRPRTLMTPAWRVSPTGLVPRLQESTEAFQSCLKTWSIFLAHLISRAEDRRRLALSAPGQVSTEPPLEQRYEGRCTQSPGGAREDHGRQTSSLTGLAPFRCQRFVSGAWARPRASYRDGVLAFLRELLKKTQFKYCGRDLNNINDVNEDAEVWTVQRGVQQRARTCHSDGTAHPPNPRKPSAPGDAVVGNVAGGHRVGPLRGRMCQRRQRSRAALPRGRGGPAGMLPAHIGSVGLSFGEESSHGPAADAGRVWLCAP